MQTIRIIRHADPDPKTKLQGPGKSRKHRPETPEQEYEEEKERPVNNEPSGEYRRKGSLTNEDEQNRITNAGGSAAMEERETEGV